MEGWGGCLCIGCIEEPKPLGRKLTPEDFEWSYLFNGFPGTRRLLKRRKYTLLCEYPRLLFGNRVESAPSVAPN